MFNTRSSLKQRSDCFPPASCGMSAKYITILPSLETHNWHRADSSLNSRPCPLPVAVDWGSTPNHSWAKFPSLRHWGVECQSCFRPGAYKPSSYAVSWKRGKQLFGITEWGQERTCIENPDSNPILSLGCISAFDSMRHIYNKFSLVLKLIQIGFDYL